MSWLSSTLRYLSSPLSSFSVFFSVFLSLLLSAAFLCAIWSNHPAETCHAKMTKRGVPGPCFTRHLKSTALWERPECERVCERVCHGGWMDEWDERHGGGRGSYLVRSSALSWCGWWWGWWAEKPPQSSPEWCPWWTAARWPDPAGSTYTQTRTQQLPNTDLSLKPEMRLTSRTDLNKS